MILPIKTEPFFQNAVNPVTDSGHILQWLDVDVAGPIFDGVSQYFLNNFNNFRLFDNLGNGFRRDYPGIFPLIIRFSFSQNFRHFANQAPSVILIDQTGQTGRGGLPNLDPHPDPLFQKVDRRQVLRVFHNDRQRIVRFINRIGDYFVGLGQSIRDQVEQFGG